MNHHQHAPSHTSQATTQAGRAFTRRSFGLLACGLSLVLGSGCGYSSKELYDTHIRSVSVPIFANRSFEREAEFKLTEALCKEIESRTPYKVTRTGSADTMITGTITRVDRRLLSRTFTAGVTQEAQVVVTVSFEWKDLRTGKILRKRSEISGTGEYVPTRPVGEPYEVGLRTAINELSRDIVSAMRSDW
jgi:hypothetical protein